jgi:hypothetical protein
MNATERRVHVLVGAAGAGALLLQLAPLHQFVVQKSSVGRDRAVAHVLVQQCDQSLIRLPRHFERPRWP